MYSYPIKYAAGSVTATPFFAHPRTHLIQPRQPHLWCEVAAEQGLYYFCHLLGASTASQQVLAITARMSAGNVQPSGTPVRSGRGHQTTARVLLISSERVFHSSVNRGRGRAL